jgi:hypothetical protein
MDASQGPGWWQAADGKWYPPQPPSGAPPATTKPNDTRVLWIIGAAALVLFCLLPVGCVGAVALLGTTTTTAPIARIAPSLSTTTVAPSTTLAEYWG